MPSIRIGDVAQIIDGAHATPKKTKSGKVYLGIRAISSDGKIAPENFDYLSDEDFTKWSKRTSLQKDDVVFSYEATLNRYALIPKGLIGCLGRRLAIVRIKDKEVIDPKWLYYYFQTQSWQAFIENNIFTGSTVNRISIDEFPNYTVLAPSISTQKIIAGLLSLLDEKIELNNKINAELESTARALYNHWFVQFDFPDESGRPYKTAGGAMVYSEELKREIPTRWTVEKLRDLLEFNKGTEVGSDAYGDSPKEDSVRFYRVGDINSVCTTYVDKSSALNIVKPSDVIVTFDGTVGKLGLGLDGAISSGLRKIYDKSGIIDNSFVWLLFLDPRTKNTIEKYATGSVLLHASSSINYLNTPFNKEVVMRFKELAKPIFEQYVNNKAEVVRLVRLRDFLLPMLMNGQAIIKD